ncbi:hypothetical protein BDZ97DRAFT_1757457 [Flammula alnicola]|nr:hypothetical protein BDZ97DRAFT_1757457 [Flammula alnicola]
MGSCLVAGDLIWCGLAIYGHSYGNSATSLTWVFISPYYCNETIKGRKKSQLFAQMGNSRSVEKSSDEKNCIFIIPLYSLRFVRDQFEVYISLPRICVSSSQSGYLHRIRLESSRRFLTLHRSHQKRKKSSAASMQRQILRVLVEDQLSELGFGQGLALVLKADNTNRPLRSSGPWKNTIGYTTVKKGGGGNSACGTTLYELRLSRSAQDTPHEHCRPILNAVRLLRGSSPDLEFHREMKCPARKRVGALLYMTDVEPREVKMWNIVSPQEGYF